ncbi:Protein of unknown function, partial [Gryllus bimaculatus]
EGSYTKTKEKCRPKSKNISSRPWNKENASKALTVEIAHTKVLKNEILIIRFPDPELTKEMVKNFYPGIETYTSKFLVLPGYILEIFQQMLVLQL